MIKLYAILCGLTLFACQKKQEVIMPENGNESLPPAGHSAATSHECTPNALSPATFVYNATVNYSIEGASDTLIFQGNVEDYGPVVREKITSLYFRGGGTLFIAPGSYPMLTSTALTFYPTPGIKKLAIVGLPDNQGNLPVFHDKVLSRTPHPFIYFSSTPLDHIEFYISAIEIQGNNVPLSDSHPYYMKKDIYGMGIFMGNMKKVGIANVKVNNIYGDGIQIYNWSEYVLTDYNIGLSYTIINSHLINNWSDNGNTDSGDGIIFFHANNPQVINSVISNNYSQNKKYGRGGIVIEGGTKNAKVANTFIQGYRGGIICERDFGGHEFLNNRIFNNQSTGISFAHDINEVRALGPSAYKPTKILGNTFEYHQTYLEYGASLWSFIVMNNFGHALAGMEIKDNVFIAHERQSPSDKDSWWTVGNPFNFYIKVDGQQDLIVINNTYK